MSRVWVSDDGSARVTITQAQTNTWPVTYMHHVANPERIAHALKKMTDVVTYDDGLGDVIRTGIRGDISKAPDDLVIQMALDAGVVDSIEELAQFTAAWTLASDQQDKHEIGSIYDTLEDARIPGQTRFGYFEDDDSAPSERQSSPYQPVPGLVAFLNQVASAVVSPINAAVDAVAPKIERTSTTYQKLPIYQKIPLAPATGLAALAEKVLPAGSSTTTTTTTSPAGFNAAKARFYKAYRWQPRGRLADRNRTAKTIVTDPAKYKFPKKQDLVGLDDGTGPGVWAKSSGKKKAAK
jgi:hypothetical protein